MSASAFLSLLWSGVLMIGALLLLRIARVRDSDSDSAHRSMR